MNTNFRIGGACAAIAVALLTIGCSKQQEQNASTTARQTLNQADKVATKALDKGGKVATKAFDNGAKATANVTLTGTVKAKLAETKGVPYDTIDVSTVNGVVTLSGTVKNATQKRLAAAATLSTPGVTKVNDTIKIG